MLGPQLQVRGHRHRRLVPELCDGFVIEPVAQRGEENAGQCAVMEARIEACEPSTLLPHGRGDVWGTAAGHHLDGAGS